MKHIIPLRINTGTKVTYQILMGLGILLMVAGTALAFVATPLIVPAGLGLILFLITYFTLKEVLAGEVNLIVEANGDELKVYRENNKGYQAVKAVLKASELSSVKVILLKGSFGLTYYSIETRTKKKGPFNHKIIRLLSAVLETDEAELLNILYVIKAQYPEIQIGH